MTARAQAGDEVARQAFATIGTWLGVGLANLVAAFDPALLVVGGGVSTVGDLLLEPAREALARSLVGVRPPRPCRRSCPPPSVPRPAPSAPRMLARRSGGLEAAR